jgi:hypothetical protein
LVSVEVPEQLEGEVLEGQRRPVPELQHVKVFRQRLERGDRRIGKVGVARGNQLAEGGGGDVRGENPQKLKTQLRIGQRGEALQLTGKIRQRLREKQPAVGCEPSRNGVRKPEGGVWPRVEMKRIGSFVAASRSGRRQVRSPPPGNGSVRVFQAERGMRDPRRLIRLVLGDHDRDLDLRRADQLEVDARLGQRIEQRRGHAAVGAHADTDDRQLRDAVVEFDGAADFLEDGCEAFLHLGNLGERHRESQVRDAAATDVLHNHVDVDIRIGQRTEDLGRGAGLVGDAADDDLGLVLVHGDAADHDLFHVGDFLFHDGSWVVVERGADFKDDAVLRGELDRARLHDLRAERRQLEHLVVGDLLEFLRVLHHPRVGGVDAVDVRVDLALVGLDRRGRARSPSSRTRRGRAW